MIHNDADLDQAIDQMARMYRSLAELHGRSLPAEREKYELFAEGPLEEIRRLHADMHQYLAVPAIA